MNKRAEPKSVRIKSDIDWQDLFDAISRFLNAPVFSRKTWWIAYSGGLDSSVLMHAVAKIRATSADRFPEVQALHINHQMSLHAATWANHCEQQATMLDIPIEVVAVDVCKQGDGIEAAARQARYQAFAKRLIRGDCLLQGHHLNDQVETVLFRLFRGHGAAGLAGIPEQRSLGQGQIIRPFLPISRSRLQQIATDWGINWIEDESNIDQSLDRNYIRHTVLSTALCRWPSALKRIGKAAQWSREAGELATSLAELDLANAKCEENSLDREIFLKLPPVRQKNLLKYWLQQNKQMLSERHLEKLLDTIHACKLRPSQMELRDCQALYINSKLITYLNLDALHKNRIELTIDKPYQDIISLGLTPLGFLQLVFVEDNPARKALLRAPQENEKVSVRYREGGERFRPIDRQGSCSLKKWFNEKSVPGWKRSVLPIIYYNDRIAAVADMAVDEDFSSVGKGFKVEIANGEPV